MSRITLRTILWRDTLSLHEQSRRSHLDCPTKREQRSHPHWSIVERSENSGTTKWSHWRTSAGNVWGDTPPLGAAAEAKPPGSASCPGVTIPFIQFGNIPAHRNHSMGLDYLL